MAHMEYEFEPEPMAAVCGSGGGDDDGPAIVLSDQHRSELIAHLIKYDIVSPLYPITFAVEDWLNSLDF